MQGAAKCASELEKGAGAYTIPSKCIAMGARAVPQGDLFGHMPQRRTLQVRGLGHLKHSLHRVVIQKRHTVGQYLYACARSARGASQNIALGVLTKLFITSAQSTCPRTSLVDYKYQNKPIVRQRVCEHMIFAISVHCVVQHEFCENKCPVGAVITQSQNRSCVVCVATHCFDVMLYR